MKKIIKFIKNIDIIILLGVFLVLVVVGYILFSSNEKDPNLDRRDDGTFEGTPGIETNQEIIFDEEVLDEYRDDSQELLNALPYSDDDFEAELLPAEENSFLKVLVRYKSLNAESAFENWKDSLDFDPLTEFIIINNEPLEFYVDPV